MDIIDKIKEVGSEAYKFTQENTSRIAKETKIKLKISQNKSKIEEFYEKIGKEVYKAHLCEEETDSQKNIDDIIANIDELSKEIENYNLELLNLKDMKKCENCAKEINIEAKFCPECGAKQKEEEAKEVEILEDEK